MTLTDRPPAPDVAAPVIRRVLPTSQIVAGVVLVLIGALWVLERAGSIDISVTAVLGLATTIIGVSLMIFAGEKPHGGLIVFGTILALITLLTAAAPFEGFQGGVGDRTIAVSSTDDISADYDLAMGTLTIDLRGIGDLQAGTPLSASVGMGELLVRVPEGTEVKVTAEVGAGQLEIFGKVTDGVGIDQTYQSPGYEQSSASLALDLQAFTGRVEVTDG